MKKKNKKIKKVLPIALLTPLASLTSLTSCGLFTARTWSWDVSSKTNTKINYCLLIGQNDHSDSIERTRFTRNALGTLDKSEETKARTHNNPNIAEPIDGKLTIHEGESGEHTFEVKELEHMEQKSMAGATWDPITANSSASTWISKHGSDITFFVSNNDSMAEGAYWASNWIKGLPIFGYDANPSTIRMINAGYVTGTVDQNASTQCGAAMMMLRNMIDARIQGHEHYDKDYDKQDYHPMKYGFKVNPTGEETDNPNGYVDDNLITTDPEGTEEQKEKWKNGRSVLSYSTAITDKNVKDYLNDDGSAKTPAEMFDTFTKIKKNPTAKKGNILMTYNNRAEVYLVSTLKPYFNEYASRLNLDLDVLEGDGTGEGVVINQIKTKHGTKYDGFLINMTYTTSADAYIEELAQIAAESEKPDKNVPEGGWEDYSQRLNTPVIFWNRQPQKDGAVDPGIMNNRYFKHTYFVGVDAPAGGYVQGQMIKEKITEWYDKSQK